MEALGVWGRTTLVVKVHNQFGDTLAGKLLHSGFNIELEPAEVICSRGESAYSGLITGWYI